MFLSLQITCEHHLPLTADVEDAVAMKKEGKG